MYYNKSNKMPFLNPFSKKESKRFKKKENKQKPLVIADIHEKNSLVLAELHSNKDIELAINSLKVGDYLIGKTIIERKTTSDFISSMINKRLVSQLNQMKQYSSQLLIIEGNTANFETFHNPNAVRGMIISIITNYQTPIIFTKDYEDTSDYLVTLAKQQLKKPQEISLHSRIPKTLVEQKQYILQSFPNIGPITAKKLLDKFKNIQNIFNAPEQELEEILKKRTKEFKRILDS